jgi:hypothetical protein
MHLPKLPEGTEMKSGLMSGVALATGLLSCITSFAQPGAMRVPMVPQAIETHMQQKRTLEQREAIGEKAAMPKAQQPSSPKLPAVKKSKKAKSQRPEGGVAD